MISLDQPSHKARPIVAGETLTFPCWLYRVFTDGSKSWAHYKKAPDFMPEAATHYHPDQPEAPTERPDKLPTTECLQGQPGDVCSHKFCQPVPSSSRPANEGGALPKLKYGGYVPEVCRVSPAPTLPATGKPPAKEGETPRTDAAVWREFTHPKEVVHADFARQLERETIALKQRIAELESRHE